MKLQIRSLPGIATGLLIAFGVASALAAALDVSAVADELRQLEADEKTAGIAQEAIDRGKLALDRARSLAAQKQMQAEEQLALEAAAEWTGVARNLKRARATEEQATALEQQQREAKTGVARARALLEQSVARRGRVEVQVRQLESGPAATAPDSAPNPVAGEPLEGSAQ